MSRGKDTKTQILEMGARLASLTGISGLSFGQLAKAVGMSKSGLYAHFDDKSHLQLGVLERASEHFTENVLKPSFAEPRGEPRLRALFNNWMSYVVGGEALPGGSIFISAAVELDDQPGELRNYVQKVQREMILHIERATQIAVDEGHFRKNLDVQVFAWSLYSLVLGYHHSKKLLDDPHAGDYFKKCFNTFIDFAAGKNRNVVALTESRLSKEPKSGA